MKKGEAEIKYNFANTILYGTWSKKIYFNLATFEIMNFVINFGETLLKKHVLTLVISYGISSQMNAKLLLRLWILR